MAEAAAFPELPIFSPDGEGDRPAGEAIEVGRIKSSRFMGSLFAVIIGAEVCWLAASSLDLRNCAMPLGAEVAEGALVGFLLSILAIIC